MGGFEEGNRTPISRERQMSRLNISRTSRVVSVVMKEVHQKGLRDQFYFRDTGPWAPGT